MRPRVYLVLAALLLGSVVAGLGLSWTAFGEQFDRYAYDFLFRLEPAPAIEPTSIILAIDDATLTTYGGMSHVRDALADGLERIQSAGPAAVAVDLLLI